MRGRRGAAARRLLAINAIRDGKRVAVTFLAVDRVYRDAGEPGGSDVGAPA